MYFMFHKTTCVTGRVIAKALGFRRFGTLSWMQRRGHNPDFLVRWGTSEGQDIPGRTINCAQAISNAADKLRAFQIMSAAGIRVPRFTNTSHDATQWGKTVFGRTRHGSKGRGITIYEPGEAIGYGHALYTEYIPNDREYRFHVVGDEVVRVQRKYLERPNENRDRYIQNHENGYVFKAPARRLKPDREELAVNAVKSLGLDFGAVDAVIGADDQMYVLEVNTAPACSPLTAQAYVNAIAELVQQRSNGDYILHPNFGELEGLANPEEYAGVMHNG